MTIDWTISISSLITVFVLIASGVAGWAIMRLKVSRLEADLTGHRTQTSTLFAAVDATLKIQGERIEDVRGKSAHELAEFKLEVAKDYAGHVALREMEARLVKAIDVIVERLDRSETRSVRTR